MLVNNHILIVLAIVMTGIRIMTGMRTCMSLKYSSQSSERFIWYQPGYIVPNLVDGEPQLIKLQLRKMCQWIQIMVLLGGAYRID